MKHNRFHLFFVMILLVMLLVHPTGLKAQQFNAGVFGGVTASQVDGDTYGGFNKLGMTAGAFVNRYIDWDIYWQLELKYVMRGVYEGPGDFNVNLLYKSSYHYLEFPLSVHYLFNEKVQVELGTSPEVLLFARFWDQDGLIDPGSYPENRRFGLSVFAGVLYWLTPYAGVGIRYTYSAIPFRNPQEWNNPQYRGYFHNVLSLTGYFQFKH